MRTDKYRFSSVYDEYEANIMDFKVARSFIFNLTNREAYDNHLQELQRVASVDFDQELHITCDLQRAVTEYDDIYQAVMRLKS